MSISACHPRTDSADSGIAAKQRLPLWGDFLTGGDEGGESKVLTTNFTNGHESSAVTITDATGTTEGRYRYTAFGGAANTVTTTTFAANQPYRFSTKYLDKEVETSEGTYFYGYRHYVPVIGRWPSRDPIGERGGVNLYGMVGNYAVERIDFLGLADLTVHENCKGREYLYEDYRFLSEDSDTDKTLYSFPSPDHSADIDYYYNPKLRAIVKVPDDVDVEVQCVCENGKWILMIKIETDQQIISDSVKFGFDDEDYYPEEHDDGYVGAPRAKKPWWHVYLRPWTGKAPNGWIGFDDWVAFLRRHNLTSPSRRRQPRY